MCCHYSYQNEGLNSDVFAEDIPRNNIGHVYTYKHQMEDFIFFTIAVILFCVGALICVINATHIGKCMIRVDTSGIEGFFHFKYCTYY